MVSLYSSHEGKAPMHGNVMFKTLRVLKRFQNNGSVCLLISLLDTQVLPNVFTIECRAITSI